jgi:hypothetical protein
MRYQRQTLYAAALLSVTGGDGLPIAISTIGYQNTLCMSTVCTIPRLDCCRACCHAGRVYRAWKLLANLRTAMQVRLRTSHEPLTLLTVCVKGGVHVRTGDEA